MNVIEQTIIFAGETFVLTNQRVLYWPEKDTLVLSDLHLGKAAHFRKHGIALPRQIAEQDLLRLSRLITHYAARQVVITGDLIHAGANKEVELFATLTSQFPDVTFILIKGNHDRLPDSELQAMGIHAVHKTWHEGDIHFSHHYADMNGVPTISGHIHPGVSLPLPTKKHSRYPCYVITERQIVLPAFSSFTGLDTWSLPERSVCYGFYEGGFFKVDMRAGQ